MSGLKCPIPVLKTKQFLAPLKSGVKVKIITTDPDAFIDLQDFCKKTGHILISQTYEKSGTLLNIIQRR